MFNKKVNHTKSPPENSFSGGFLNLRRIKAYLTREKAVFHVIKKF